MITLGALEPLGKEVVEALVDGIGGEQGVPHAVGVEHRLGDAQAQVSIPAAHGVPQAPNQRGHGVHSGPHAAARQGQAQPQAHTRPDAGPGASPPDGPHALQELDGGDAELHQLGCELLQRRAVPDPAEDRPARVLPPDGHQLRDQGETLFLGRPLARCCQGHRGVHAHGAAAELSREIAAEHEGVHHASVEGALHPTLGEGNSHV